MSRVSGVHWDGMPWIVASGWAIFTSYFFSSPPAWWPSCEDVERISLCSLVWFQTHTDHVVLVSWELGLQVWAIVPAVSVVFYWRLLAPWGQCLFRSTLYTLYLAQRSYSGSCCWCPWKLCSDCSEFKPTTCMYCLGSQRLELKTVDCIWMPRRQSQSIE